MRMPLLVLLAVAPLHAAAPPAVPTAEQARRLRDRDAHFARALAARKESKAGEVIAALEKALAINVRVNGPWHRYTERRASDLASWHEGRQHWARAVEYRRQVAEARARLDGERHWRTIDARLDLEEARRQPGRTDVQRRALAEADRLTIEANRLHRGGEMKKGVAPARQAMELRRSVLGEKHRGYADSLHNLAAIMQEAGEERAALPLHRRSIEIYRATVGDRHPSYASAVNSLAHVYTALRDDRAALPLAREVASLRRELLGPRHPHYANSLHNLARCYEATGDLRAAVPLFRQVVDIYRESVGVRHPWYATGVQSLGSALRDMGDHNAALPLLEEALALAKLAGGERSARYASVLNSLAGVHRIRGDYKAALDLYQRSLRLVKERAGERTLKYAITLDNLAMVHHKMGGHDAAVFHCRRALALLKDVVGTRHRDYAIALSNLAEIYREAGDHRAALPLYEESLALKKAAVGERHPDYAGGLNNLALLHHDVGDYKTALPLFRRSMAMRKELLGENHPDYAQSLNNLAMIHNAVGDQKAAVALYEQSLALTKELRGERERSYAITLNNLARIYGDVGRVQVALPLCRQALKIFKESLGERSPDYAIALNNLGHLHIRAGDLDAALTAYRQALTLTRAARGERHPTYAGALNNLGALYKQRGDFEAALPLSRQAVVLSRELQGETHPDHAVALHNLAAVYYNMNRLSAALPLQEESLRLTRRSLALAADVLSERQHLAATDEMRKRLDARLSLPEESASFSHQHVLAWKGTIFAAQQARREFVRLQADPATRRLATELADAAHRLALLSSRGDPASRKRMEKLIREKEEKESRLAEASDRFRATRTPPTTDLLRSRLPAGTVLVDVLAYTGHDPTRPLKGQHWERRFAAWVVRPGSPTARVEVGPAGPIEEAVARWRAALEKGESDREGPALLRRLVWGPLEKHLAGAKLVLISPDGALARLPFAALPGSAPGRYLMEDVPLAVVPVPRILPELLRRTAGEPSLLAVGGVPFDLALSGRPRTSERGGLTWQSLPGTAAEVEAVVARFRRRGNITPLTGTRATRAAVRDALSRHRHAHLATHGFFAPANMPSALSNPARPEDTFQRDDLFGWHPGLLSGLVLAGANNPTDEDDGVLTALEIAVMDLSSLDLAVLSACQTGLGQEAAGEGLLGLQRAFAMAGCKSVVSSLWSVNDAATSILMERFYHHLWTEKRSKLESLRQAQLDVLRHPEWVEDRAKKLAAGKLLVRGVGKASVPLPKTGERRSPPAWWAAWQLSGDWR